MLAQIAESVKRIVSAGRSAVTDALEGARFNNTYDEVILDGVGEDVFFDLSEAGQSREDRLRNNQEERRPRVFAEPLVLRRGEILNESGSGFTAGGSVVMYFELPAGRTVEILMTADANGNLSADYRIPGDSPLGAYSYYAKDETTNAVSDRVKYQVLERAAPVAEVERARQQAAEEARLTDGQASQSVSEGESQSLANTCSFDTRQAPSRQSVIINEVAWMGTTASASNEWIELRNISGREININGWQLVDAGDDIRIIFGDEDKRGISRDRIPVNDFYLLERTDDDSVHGVAADFIYVGALSNSGGSSSEGLRLFNANCQLIDEVLANPDWPAGNAVARKTMERGDGFNWHESQFIDGTPKQKNSTPLPSPSPPTTSSGGGGGGSGSSPSPPPQPTATISAASQSLSYEQSTTISWSSANVTSCSLKKGGVETATGMSGSYTTPSLVADTIYSVTCVGDGGTVTKSVNVAVGQPPASQETATSTSPQESSSNPPPVTWCVLNQSASPTHTVLLNEIAWAGTGSSSISEEWIELRSTVTSRLLNGWQLQDATGEIKIAFDANDSIENGYFLLRRILTSDDPVASYFVGGAAADKTYTGILQNSNESLWLFDNQCVLVDTVIANPDWPAGEAPPNYLTAERSDDLSWHSFNGNGVNGIMGTPRGENSAPLLQSNPVQELTLPPTAPGGIMFSFNETNSQLIISWEKSTDPDSVESDVAYDGNINSAGWALLPFSIETGSSSRLRTEIAVEQGVTYAIQLRAVDEVGNYSGIASAQYDVPIAALPLNVASVRWGNILTANNVDIVLQYSYPVGSSSGEGAYTAVVFFLNQMPTASYNFNHSSVHPYDFSGAGNNALAVAYGNCGGYGGPMAGVVLHNNDGANCQSEWAISALLQNVAHAALPSIAGGNIILSVSGAVIGAGATNINSVGIDTSYGFSVNDYITLGFYEFNRSTAFRQVAAHSRPIYFTSL